jgi:hypothetical protein
MSSWHIDFDTANSDCRFAERMKSLLSQSRHRVKGTFFGVWSTLPRNFVSGYHYSALPVMRAVRDGLQPGDAQ